MRLTTAAALLLLAATASAQGSNSCTTPQLVAGVGPHPFNNSTATTTGGEGALVCAPIGRDVWFRWVAPTTSGYAVSNCFATGVDTILAVYDGSACPGAPEISCNDDSSTSCGTGSRAVFDAVAGQSYVFRLGSYSTNSGGTGTFTVELAPLCKQSIGPDVIVGDLHEIANYNASSGVDALSLGTTSCNLGSVWLNWEAGTNQHPVIGGNLYQYRVVSGAGRFEQIGMSWLKHGFYALSLNLCCANCVETDGTHLGLSCSDPYTAGRNGGQATLGPRWQVDANTGAFPYPPANPSYSGSTARRLEFLQSELALGVDSRWFGEGQYVTPDDAAAGNQNNNASWRELSASAGSGSDGFNFALLGTTTRQESAIEAWALCEPGVNVVDVQVPGEGFFHVAWKVTNLGGGQYHYEYAVHNMNSDRSGGAFTLPIGIATLTNIGFHDVAYRNGDGKNGTNRVGTDWTVTQTASSIRWATIPEATDENANALRWGTTYNFRFDANAAPTTAGATLGLWKTGSPADVVVAVEVPGQPPSGIPYCSGDGTATPCPCATTGSAGNGCPNSLFPAGARLDASGVPSLTGDTLALSGSGMPNSAALYYQGTTAQSGGLGAIFGDGLRCVAGTTRRFQVQMNVSFASQYPGVGNNPISVAGALAGSGTRRYQCWYRNGNPSFCTVDTFNLTNGLTVTWIP